MPHYLWLLILSVFSFWVAGVPFLDQGTLYWDTGRFFSQVRDTLHSLNHFGELPLWMPQYQSGFAGYYLSFLNIHSITCPSLWPFLFLSWGLGQLGISIARFQPFYLFQIGLVIPLIFIFSLDRFAKALSFSLPYRRYLAVLAAFSPGVLFSYSDVGFLEPLSYGLLWFAYWIEWNKEGSEGARRGLVFASCLLGVSLNNSFLYWNVIALPLGIGLIAFFFPIRRLHITWIEGGAIALSLFPALLVLSQGQDLVRLALGGKPGYDLVQMKGGNPLELLTTQIPGVGFDWGGLGEWKLLPFSKGNYTAYSYLGLLTFPLSILGMMQALHRRKMALAIALLTFGFVICLSSSSPFMLFLLKLIPKLSTCNHFGDVTFKAGTFVLILLLALYGLRRIEQSGAARKQLSFILTLSLFFSFFIQFVVYGERIVGNPYTSWLLLLGLCYFIVLRFKVSLSALLLFALVDVGTHAHLFSRKFWGGIEPFGKTLNGQTIVDERENSDQVGMAMSQDIYHHYNTFVGSQSYIDLLLGGYFKTPQEKFSLTSSGTVQPVSRSYNRWEFETESATSTQLILRDGYSPYWKAFINGKEVEVVKKEGHFKQIAVPAGKSTIKWVFQPPGVRLAFWLAVFATLGTLTSLLLQGVTLSPSVRLGSFERYRAAE